MPSYEEFFRTFPHRLRDLRLYLGNPTFGNPPWDTAAFRVLILRLSTFADVERSTPHVFLADELRRWNEAAYIDMAFLPGRDDARALQDSGLPLLLGTQSHHSLEDFDLLLISNSWLLELVNLPFLFLRSGVPLWASLRDARWPPVILGGSNASAAHAVVSENADCMADAIFFGEGEGAVAAIAEGLHRRAREPKEARLRQTAAEVKGLWPAGDLSRPAQRAVGAAGGQAAAPWSAPVLPGPEAGTQRISITLGCPCFCSFCFEGQDRKPYREIPADSLIEAARARKLATGAETLELASFNFNTHSGLAQLLISLHTLWYRVGFMSQRADILARTAGLLDLEIAADKRSFTLGIEGISARLRRFLHKSLDERDIRSALEAVHGRRTRELKLFYILTGREEEGDFTEFSEFVKWLKAARRKSEAGPRLVFSFGLLVRMPFTPLRHDPPVLSEQAWRPLMGRSKSICETNGFEFRFSSPWPVYAATQALALSGYSAHRLLEALALRGCITEEGLPPGADQDVNDWISGHADDLSGEKPADYPFPFSFLETPNSRAALFARYQRAREGRDSGYRVGGAAGEERASLQESARALALITTAKHNLKPFFVQARLPRESAGLGTEWGNAWLMRALLAGRPGLVDTVLAVRECVIDQSGAFGTSAGWFGWTVAAVTAWDQKLVEEALASLPGVFAPAPQGFTPGVFENLHVVMDLAQADFPDPAGALAAFLQSVHCPVTAVRKGGSVSLVVAEKAVRKKLLLSATAHPREGGCRLDLVIGSKLRLGDFLDSFGTAGPARGVVVEVIAVS